MMQICYKDTTKYRIWLFIRLFFTLIFSILPESGALGGVVVFCTFKIEVQKNPSVFHRF